MRTTTADNVICNIRVQQTTVLRRGLFLLLTYKKASAEYKAPKIPRVQCQQEQCWLSKEIKELTRTNFFVT
jgi:hypothetical protein